MKILAISEAGYSCDLLLRMAANGHHVLVWIKEKEWKQLYDGILDKVSDWKPYVKWADFIFFDHSGMSDIWKQVKDIKPCFGGSEWADKLEKDRIYAHKIFKDIGLKSFESLRAKTFQEALAHVLSHKVKHVIKPSGKEIESHHLIISEDPSGEDAAALINSYIEQGLKADYIEIEERKDGIEVGISGWFTSSNGKGSWIGDINVNFEHKRFATGSPEGLGFLTGEMGTAMIYQSPDNAIFKKTLAKMKTILQENNYRGQIDLSFIVDEKTGAAYPLEATPRLGYPACMIEQPLQVTPFEDLFYNIAYGNTKFVNKTSSDWAVGVVVVTPGYPSLEEAKKKSKNLPVFGITPSSLKQTHLVEVKSVDSKIMTAPGMGYPMVVTGTGETIQEAKTDAYKLLDQKNPKRLRVPNAWWRTDIGDRVVKQLPDLYRLGVLEQKLPIHALMAEHSSLHRSFPVTASTA